MAYELEVIAKEITLAVLPRVSAAGESDPEPVGKRYGQLYKTILKTVVEAVNEARK